MLLQDFRVTQSKVVEKYQKERRWKTEWKKQATFCGPESKKNPHHSGGNWANRQMVGKYARRIHLQLYLNEELSDD